MHPCWRHPLCKTSFHGSPECGVLVAAITDVRDPYVRYGADPRRLRAITESERLRQQASRTRR